MSHDDRAIPTITPEHPEHRRRHRDEFDKLLENATRLLTYAVDAGIQVDTRATTKIIAAIHSGHSAWESTDAGELANAIATLAAAVHPVTPETLHATLEDAHRTIGIFKQMSYWLAAFIVPLSILSFIATGISATIANDLKAANEIVVTLHLHLDTQNSSAPPPLNTSAELQQFAAQIRDVFTLGPVTRSLCELAHTQARVAKRAPIGGIHGLDADGPACPKMRASEPLFRAIVELGRARSCAGSGGWQIADALV
jgi:hypothetical protein